MEKLRAGVFNIKLRTKFVLIVSVALAAVFGLTLAMSRMPYAAYDEQLYRSNVQTVSLFADKLESRLDAVAGLSFRMLSDDVMQKNLTLLRRTQLGTVAWVEAKNEVERRVGYYAYNAQDILSLHVTTAQGLNFFYAFGSGDISAAEKAQLTRAVEDAGGREKWLIFPGEPVRLMLARQVRETDGLTLAPLGVIMIRVDVEQILGQCLSAMARLGCPLSAAVYEGDTCLYASDEAILSLPVAPDGYAPALVEGRQVLCVRFTSKSGWRFVTALPYDEILGDIRTASRRALALSLLAAVAALMVSGVLIATILRHLNVLIDRFDAFAVGTLPCAKDLKPYENRRDEIGRLHRHFDRMARAYDRMTRENYDKQLLLREAQVRQLRAQIRPHFLYNTLESIYCLSKFSGDERIATMTDALGKLLRASLSEQRDVVPLEADWRIAEEYLRIQRLRYGERLLVENALDPALARTPIPSMTLQPIVENAVQHAAEEMSETCVIRVYARACAQDVEVVVEDNGPGMDEEILEKLACGALRPDGLGIGLNNIQRRIALHFSDRYGLRIRREGGRTQVIVRLPSGKGEEDAHV